MPVSGSDAAACIVWPVPGAAASVGVHRTFTLGCSWGLELVNVAVDRAQVEALKEHPSPFKSPAAAPRVLACRPARRGGCARVPWSQAGHGAMGAAWLSGLFSSRVSPRITGPSTPSPLAGEGWDGGEKHGLGTPLAFTPTLALPRLRGREKTDRRGHRKLNDLRGFGWGWTRAAGWDRVAPQGALLGRRPREGRRGKAGG